MVVCFYSFPHFYGYKSLSLLLFLNYIQNSKRYQNSLIPLVIIFGIKIVDYLTRLIEGKIGTKQVPFCTLLSK
jgi:hypothetical protein